MVNFYTERSEKHANMKDNKRVLIILIAILAIVFLTYRSYLKRNPIERGLEKNKDLIDKVEEIALSGPLEKKSEFKGNSLENGSSPFDNLYGKGIYQNTQHSLTIKNQSSSDVVILLVSVDDNMVIRNEYIQANSTYNLTKLPNSTCYVKYYYGQDWNPTRKTKNVTTGGFDNNEQHIISDNPGDIIEFKEEINGEFIYYSTFELILETIIETGNTMSEENISPSEFF